MKEIALALGLPETASTEDIIAAIKAQKDKNKDQEPSKMAANSESNINLNLYVPRSEYDLQKNLAINAQQELANFKQAQLKASAEALINEALKEGKIVPANKEHYLKIACNQEDGLEMVKNLISNNPVIANNSGLDNKTPDISKTALNAEEQEICRLMNIKPEEFIKTKNQGD